MAAFYILSLSLMVVVGLGGARPVAITQEGSLTTFWYNSSATDVATFTFDYCNIVSCPSVPWQCNIYTSTEKSIYICVTDDYWGQSCGYWGAVGWNTGTDWKYRPQSAMDRKDKNGTSLISRMTLSKTGTCLTGGEMGRSMPLTLTIENPSPGDAGTYILGAYLPGVLRGAWGKFQLKDMFNSTEWETAQTPSASKPNMQTLGNMIG